MTGVLALGCFGTGFAVGWILRTAYKMAEMSWWQERMQRKVHYWQGQAIHARAIAELRLRQLAAVTGQEPAAPDWPPAAGRRRGVGTVTMLYGLGIAMALLTGGAIGLLLTAAHYQRAAGRRREYEQEIAQNAEPFATPGYLRHYMPHGTSNNKAAAP